jgi:hypothetical protein
VANIEIKIKEKVAQNGWPILAHFNWPLTGKLYIQPVSLKLPA